MIQIKSKKQVDRIRESSRILVDTFKFIEKNIKAGVKLIEIDKEIESFIRSKKAVPSFKDFNGFPGSVCISVDEEIVHGIPDKRVLKNGQIVGIDIGVNYAGYFSDAAFTFKIGEVEPEIDKLLKVTKESLYLGIKEARCGERLSNISHAIQKHGESNQLSVVRELVGHGVGLDVWELPQIPNYGNPGKGPKLREGMVLAIEPMFNLGTFDIETKNDGWTVVTKDRKPSAHFEHTIVIDKDETQILTEGIGENSFH
ncbi:type I methionyl aminopeptidase [candidate division KSB1 bacterium]|nr:type I methionyl aminopeptidase [candidate division KSB1 bacterium]